jgi:membrane-bound lytic murein transglycosylase D
MDRARKAMGLMRVGTLLAVAGAALTLSGCVAQRLQPTTIPIHSIYPSGAMDPQEAPEPPGEQEPAEPTEPGAADAAGGAENEVADAAADAGEVDAAEGPLTESPLDELGNVVAQPAPVDLAEKRELAAEAPQFDIPVPINDAVLAWVELYTHRYKAAFEGGLARSGRYMERFRAIFAEEGVPQDLVYMAQVESLFKTTAYSRAHARGIFQFMTPTGRLYGLRVDPWIDERADPDKSARAAARYMKKLYGDFGDWHLALAAYNAGEGKVERAIQRAGSRDFWELANTSHLKRETRNHVPAVLAAAILSKDPEKYGLTFTPDDPLRFDVVTIDDAIDLRVLARCSGTDYAELRQLNPAIRRDTTPYDTKMAIRVPAGRGDSTERALAGLTAQQRMPEARYAVRQGDTLSLIAGRHGVSLRELQAANGMGNKTLIHSGQTLRIPVGGSMPRSERLATTTRSKAPAKATAKRSAQAAVVVHRVKSGDTLTNVAQRYGTTAQAVAAASGKDLHRVLVVGDKLTVVPGVRSASTARRVAQRPLAAGADSGDAAQARIHTVRRGETLSTIATRYRTSVNMLCSINEISPTQVLHPGSALTVGYGLAP